MFPEIWLASLSPHGVSRIFASLMSRAQSTSENPAFWSVAEDREVPHSAVPDAASLVVAGEAEAFHLVIRGVAMDGVAIPDLGVFVFHDSIALDYEPGQAWGPPELEALFALLCELHDLDPQARVMLEEGTCEMWQQRFRSAWDAYRAGTAA